MLKYEARKRKLPMTIEAQTKHLIVNKDTRIEPGTEIVGSEPSATRFVVKGQREDGGLDVEIHDLLAGEKRVAPMPLGTPIIIKSKD